MGLISVLHLVEVPPFSMAVVSGDSSYAGPALTDENTAFTCAADTTRYHVYFVMDGYSFPDGFRYLPDFEIRFLQPPSTIQGDLNPLMDAVWGQLLVVEEASTEGPAAAEESDEPELRSSAALTQQVDLVIRTKRAARSSTKK